ncbi:hypothetical protein ACNKHM_25020 [Shigella sonnei]
MALAIEAGREGVKTLKAKPVQKAAPAPAAAAPKRSDSGKTNGPKRLHGHRPCSSSTTV